MKLTRRGKLLRAFALGGIAALIAGIMWAECLLVWAQDYRNTAPNPHRYVLTQVDPDPYPGIVVFRHCGNAAEDSMGHLKMVSYEPGSKIVYRCMARGY